MNNKEMNIEAQRELYSDAITTLMIDRTYVNYSFYSFLLSKCNVVLDPKMTHIAGVGFNMNTVQYDLHLNPILFGLITKENRLAVLVHECHHILGNHTVRLGERDHDLFNVAADMAINQLISIKLPAGCIDNKSYHGKTFPNELNAEQYYELLLEQKKQEDKDKKEEDCDNDCNKDGEGDPSDGQGSGKGQSQRDKNKEELAKALEEGDLEKIKEMIEKGQVEIDEAPGEGEKGDENGDGQGGCSEIQQEVMKEITKSMIKDAAEKSKGNVPQDYSDLLELWSAPPKVSWKAELRRIISSIPNGKKLTSRRKSRRFPQRADIKGTCRDISKRNIIVGLDVSGSMSSEEIYAGLVEVNAICKVNNSDLSLIQCDTRIAGVEVFSENNKSFERKASGGTVMNKVPEYIMDKNIPCDVVVFISDMYIEDVNTDPIWKSFKKPVIWLNTSGAGNGVIPTLNKHKLINFIDM